MPITTEAVALLAANAEGERRIAAVLSDRIVGVGVILPERNELRGCYVHPSFGRMGIGQAIVAELEAIGREAGLRELFLDSSITAEQFYLRLGFQAQEKGEHILSSGRPMACIKMRKEL